MPLCSTLVDSGLVPMYPFGATSTAGGVSYSLTVQSKRCSLLTQCGTTRPSRLPHRLDHLRGNYNIQVGEQDIVPLLRRDAKEKLQATVLLEWLDERHPGRFNATHLRTLQRRIRDWRALSGPEREVYFEQKHPPGREAHTSGSAAQGRFVTDIEPRRSKTT